MLGTIFGSLILLSAVYAAFSGNMEALGAAALTGAAESVTLVLALLGTVGFWTALMRVLQDGGATAFLARLLSPLFRLFYPSAADDAVCAALASAFIANLFGLGSAAMPAGIAAVKALQSKSADAERASDETILFCVLSVVPLQIFPFSLMALRLSDGDGAPYRLLMPIWLTQIACVITAILICRIFAFFGKRRAA